MLLLLVLLAIGGVVAKAAFDRMAYSNRAALQARQHDSQHRANEDRRKRLAYAAHLKRAAYDAAHPEEVAKRKAVAAEALRVANAAKAAEFAKRREVARLAAIAAQERQARQNRESHPCDTADSLESETVSALNAGSKQRAYDSAVSGLHYNELCDDSTSKTVNGGYLLSFKAHAEHDLGIGDWRTDYNQANALLVQCQTMPGLYGTHTGAQCETQEHSNISWETHWDIEQ